MSEAFIDEKRYVSRWSKSSLEHRVKLLEKMADLIEERAEEFARAESRDQGKPLWMARTVDIPRGIHNFRIYAKCLSYDTDKLIIIILFSKKTERHNFN